jgi:hypothetical protein
MALVLILMNACLGTRVIIADTEAASSGFVECFRIFMEDERVDVYKENEMGFCTAVKYDHEEIFGLIIRDGRLDPAKYSSTEDSALHIAIERGVLPAQHFS